MRVRIALTNARKELALDSFLFTCMKLFPAGSSSIISTPSSSPLITCKEEDNYKKLTGELFIKLAGIWCESGPKN